MAERRERLRFVPRPYDYCQLVQFYFCMMAKYWDMIGWRCGASDQSCFSISVTSLAICATLSATGCEVESVDKKVCTCTTNDMQVVNK